MDTVQAIIGNWAEATFDHTAQGIAQHLLREAVELASVAGVTPAKILENVNLALVKYPAYRTVGEETADVTILAFALAHYCGFSLHTAVAAKHAVNVVREWGPKDHLGVSEHVSRP